MAQVVIIGAGVAGLATACRLRAAGHAVTVCEANAYPGGKLSEFTLAGFRFDAGPSLFTMPHLLDDVFHACQRNPRDYYNYRKLDTTCHYFFADGTQLRAAADPRAFGQEVEDKLDVPADQIMRYLAHAKKIYNTAGHIFVERPLHKIATWWNRDTLRALQAIPSLGLFSTMDEVNRKMFRDPRLVQLFNRYATYNGSDPYQAPGILTSIPHLEFNIGTFLPIGGMHTITRALYRLALDLGVEFQFETPAAKIVTTRKKVTAVRTSASTMLCDAAISNLDVTPTYRKLLRYQPAPERTLAQERSSSALIFYWGVKAQFPQLDLHNILFSADYADEFRHLFQTHTVSADPTVYINITSKYETGDAPPGHENWFVMINVPANRGQDWDAIIEVSRQHIIRKINHLLQVDLEPLIACEHVLDPRSIEDRTGSAQGSLYGTSSNNRLAAFLRHRNESSRIKGLYFCGGSVHPGGGIPLCLQSARITARLLAKQFGSAAV